MARDAGSKKKSVARLSLRRTRQHHVLSMNTTTAEVVAAYKEARRQRRAAQESEDAARRILTARYKRDTDVYGIKIRWRTRTYLSESVLALKGLDPDDYKVASHEFAVITVDDDET